MAYPQILNTAGHVFVAWYSTAKVLILCGKRKNVLIRRLILASGRTLELICDICQILVNAIEEEHILSIDFSLL